MLPSRSGRKTNFARNAGLRIKRRLTSFMTLIVKSFQVEGHTGKHLSGDRICILLRAGWSSGRTEAGVHRGERTTHLRERADDRDSELGYLLRPTRHGQGGLTIDSKRFFLVKLAAVEERRKNWFELCCYEFFLWKVQLRFESLIKGKVAKATDLRHYPHSVCDIFFVCSRQQRKVIR